MPKRPIDHIVAAEVDRLLRKKKRKPQAGKLVRKIPAGKTKILTSKPKKNHGAAAIKIKKAKSGHRYKKL